jgi:hypothetical protein
MATFEFGPPIVCNGDGPHRPPLLPARNSTRITDSDRAHGLSARRACRRNVADCPIESHTARPRPTARPWAGGRWRVAVHFRVLPAGVWAPAASTRCATTSAAISTSLLLFTATTRCCAPRCWNH